MIARFSNERNEAYREFISRCDDLEAEIGKERNIGKFTHAEVEENKEDVSKNIGIFQKPATDEVMDSVQSYCSWT